jgi:F0F1-type ATP synthase membrane subunit c/vacuolar-type H+-ATPase subunit K
MISLQETRVEPRLKIFGFRNVRCKDTPSFKQRALMESSFRSFSAPSFKKSCQRRMGTAIFSSGLSVGLACWSSCWGLAKFSKPCNQQGQHRTPTTQMTEPLVGTPASAHFVSSEPNSIFCMVFCFTEAIGLFGLIVALISMD